MIAVSEYDRLSRDGNIKHAKSTSTPEQPYQETSLYAAIEEEQIVKLAVVDADKQSSSSGNCILQVDDSAKDLKIVWMPIVSPKYQKLKVILLRELFFTHYHRSMFCNASFIIAVVAVLFSQIPVIKSDYKLLQRNLQDNIMIA